jgi:DNA-binding NarL/FixJ family response regulator
MIRVLIADDQALVRGGFRAILDAQPDIDVVGEAAEGREALQLARTHSPDVVVMGVRMPGLDGLEATRRLLSVPDTRTRVLMLTTFDLDEYLYAAIKAGASGFMLKNAPPEQLAAAVRSVAAGDALLAPALTKRLLDAFVRRPPPGSRVPPKLQHLTDREVEVLQLVARGLSNVEIADTLIVSPGTAKTHVARILAKLGVRDRVQAVVLAYESGLVEPGSAVSPAALGE